MPAKTVPDHIRVFIVTALARHMSPTEVVAAVERAYEVTVSRQYVYSLDPTRPQSRTNRVARKWAELFTTAREAFHRSLEAIPMADQGVRLQRLETLYQENDRNPVLRADLLKQAAQEVGGLFTNTRKVQGTITLEAQLRALAAQDEELTHVSSGTAPAGPGLLPRTGEVFPE